MINGILSNLAAMQTGKDEYPPIPKTKFGLLFNKKKNDLRVELSIINIELNAKIYEYINFYITWSIIIGLLLQFPIICYLLRIQRNHRLRSTDCRIIL